MLNGLPVAPLSATLDLARIAREGYPLTGTSVGSDNSVSGVASGASVGGVGPGPGQAWYITTIGISSAIDVTVRVQIGNNGIIANGAATQIGSYSVGPSFGSASIPLNTIVREGESVSFIVMTDVASGAGTNTFKFRAGFFGTRLTNDFSFENRKTWLVIGDSITNTTGPTYGSELYHAVAQQTLYGQRKGYRRIVKGDGGWATSHALIAMGRGLFDVPEPDLITVMLGTNEASSANFQTNYPTLVSYLRTRYPNAKKVFFSPPPRQGATETSVLVPIRTYMSTYIPGLSDSLCSYVDMGSAYSAVGDTNFFTTDGTTNTTRVHPNALGHAGMASVFAASPVFATL